MQQHADYENWRKWGQMGRAKIDGEWVEGAAVLRDPTNTRVLFQTFDFEPSPTGILDPEPQLTTISWSSFEIDQSIGPLFPFEQCRTNN